MVGLVRHWINCCEAPTTTGQAHVRESNSQLVAGTIDMIPIAAVRRLARRCLECCERDLLSEEDEAVDEEVEDDDVDDEELSFNDGIRLQTSQLVAQRSRD